jgi:hypothetical protein
VLRTKGADYSVELGSHNKMHALYKEKQFDAAAILCGELKG